MALHCLKEQFTKKVKLIYIDPPYNTGRDDFKYNDRFNHSTWLTFMKNRLEPAQELLRDDGVIVISIDDNEACYLKVLCDEIFGRDNFIAQAPRRASTAKSNTSVGLSQNFDWLLIYSKNSNHRRGLFQTPAKRTYYKTDDYPDKWRTHSLDVSSTTPVNPDDYAITNPKTGITYKPSSDKITWRFVKKGTGEYDKDRIIFPGDYEFLKHRDPIGRWFKAKDKPAGIGTFIFSCNDYLNQEGTEAFERRFADDDDKPVFNYPKPPALIRKLIECTTEADDIILDFFAGSGTTGDATLCPSKQDGQSRQFILVEQIEEHAKTCRRRCINAMRQEKIDNSFIYFELKKYNQIFIEQIKSARTQADILKIWEQMKAKSFLNYNIDLKEQEERMQNLQNKSLSEQKRELVECLDSNQLYVNQSSLDDAEFACSKAEKILTKAFYS